MKNYAVAILSLLENNNKIYFIEAENEIKATQLAMLVDCDSEECKKSLKDWFDDMVLSNFKEFSDELLNAEYSVDCKELPND